MYNNTTFQQFLQTAFLSGSWSTDEVIEFVLPLFEEVLSFHDNNQVGSFELQDTIFLTNGRLDIDENFTHEPSYNIGALEKLFDFRKLHGFTVTGSVQVDQDLTLGSGEVSNVQVLYNLTGPLEQPVFLKGYQCYEWRVGHHDAQTDIFCLGLILGSAIMGLDLYAEGDLNQFAAYRTQPAGLNARVHPTLCALVTEMTELNRNDRSRDLREIIQRLKNYRDYDPQREVDLSTLAAFQIKKPADRKDFIIAKLRSRLFDTSRRNRLLYYKPNNKFVNLTVSSVPMVLHYQSINPQLLFTWNSEISSLIIKTSDISLSKYLRFEDHPYLNAQLNSIRQQADKDVKEFGFSQLKLVVAFLHWHNLKEDTNERIQSPLLLMPVALERKKSLKEERFTIKMLDNAAIINPVLAHHLNELYGITLPEQIDFDDVSMEQFFDLVKQKIDDAKQGVKLNYIDKPRIKLVHTLARQTINNYRKRLKQKGAPSFHQVDYSYSEENYKPLGLELFRQKVEPKLSTLEFLLSHHQVPGTKSNFADTAQPELKSTFQLVDGDSNAYSWDFDVCNMVLGNFNYKKMSLVSDYKQVADNGIEHDIFNELFSNSPKTDHPTKAVNKPEEWYHVISADPTQAKAVLESRSGRSYIIQGPPGTGKSQTITNLVADFLARGKTVLFVCEKRAALDVVYHRLQQNRLSELCCYIHDSQGDKKEFIKDLKTIYNDFLNKRMDLAFITIRRKIILDKFLDKIETLRAYHHDQKKVNPEAGVQTRSLIETLLGIKADLPDLQEKIGDVPLYSQWELYGQTIWDLGKALENTGAEPALANHPFHNLGAAVVNADNPFTLMDSLLKNATTAIGFLSEVARQHQIPAKHAAHLESIKNLIQDSVVLEELAQSRNLKLVDTANPESKEFEELYKQYKAIQGEYKKSLESNKRWVNKFELQEVEQALALAQKHEKSFFSFLNGNWRRLKNQLKHSYNFDSHQVKPSFSAILHQLQDEYQKAAKRNEQKSILESKYRIDNIERVHVGIEVLRRKQGDQEIDYLLQHPKSNELVIQLSKLNNTLLQLEMQLQQCLCGIQGKSLSQIKDELETIGGNATALKALLPALRRFNALPENVQHFIRTVPLTPVQAQAVMANTTLQLFFKNNPAFSAMTHYTLQEAVRDIEQHYKQLLTLNSDFIRAERRAQFLRNYDISNTAAVQLTEEERIIKKGYTEGRKVLEHEMGKTMRYKSIRELASGESGNVLKNIKPVWLMSPLSVSDSLPLDTHFFDVVIYDEASQITLEEGIPALFRAPQTIIVGDDKQMPPSNFFNAKAEDPEDLETINGEKEDEILSADADSLLVQAARKLHSTILSWHYRSRFESLISYSNHAFYEAALLTIPDRTIHHNNKPLLEVHKPEEGLQTAEVLTKDSMSFHYLPSSVYEARGNTGEAKYIAHLVKKLLTDEVKDSIGIVAFSQEQQGVIEDEINALAIKDKAFDDVLERAYNRKDDGQFTGLFVKNLENVQGDERDIIIMSVCYGHDSNKKMLMHFGPINRKGGEKRLNVIFSRARKHMAVVSSIRHFHITNVYNEGANYFKRFLHYAEMVSTGDMATARRILDGLITSERRSPTYNRSSVAAVQIKNALQSKGYFVEEGIGQSSFKCSLGVKKYAADSQYALGILVDDACHYDNDNLVEQYFQRPAILKSFGWRMINVYAKDWLEDSERVIHQIINRLENKEETIKDKDQMTDIKPQIKPVDSNLILLKSADGEKFWEITRKGAQLNIRSGKTGTQGVMQVKTYVSEDEANLARDEYIEDQKKNGFEPVN